MVVQILGSFLSEVFHSDSIFFQSTFDSKNGWPRRGRSSSSNSRVDTVRPVSVSHTCVTHSRGTPVGGFFFRLTTLAVVGSLVQQEVVEDSFP